MNRKTYILMLLLLSWPVNNIHRVMDGMSIREGKYYLFSDYVETIHWYVHDLCGAISTLMVLYAIWLYIVRMNRKSPEIVQLMGSMVIVQLIDIFHYIGWHRRNYAILIVEAMVIIIPILKRILIRLKKK